LPPTIQLRLIASWRKSDISRRRFFESDVCRSYGKQRPGVASIEVVQHEPGYRIFYRIIEDARRVEILVVWHGARRDPKFGKG
jgi:hypothetical protein